MPLPPCLKCSLGISNFLEESSSLSHSIVFLYVFAFITEEGFLISPCYSLEYLLPCYLPRPNYCGGNEDNSDPPQKVPCMYCYTQCPQSCKKPPLTHASTEHSWTFPSKSDQSLVGSLLFSPVSWCTQGSFCILKESVSLVLCKFRQLYGGVNGDLLQEGLCHTQVCCTQSPFSPGSPLLTHTTKGDTQTQFCLSVCGVSGSWCAQGLFEASEHLWWEWGLILNVNSSLLLSCWGFFFVLGHAISPQCRYI